MKETRLSYSQELKESIARRYILTDATYDELAAEIGGHKSTVCGWVQEFKKRGSVGKRSKKAKTTDSRTAEDKLRLVVQAAALPEEDRGEFLRREGVHDDDLARWKQDALGGLQGDGASRSQDKRIRDLERASLKQGRRLREAEALLDLQKKVQALWGDEDDDMSDE